MNDLHNAAREYCGYGWRIIPTRGKAPCGGVGWPSKATSDAGEAMAMIDDTQADGVGVLWTSVQCSECGGHVEQGVELETCDTEDGKPVVLCLACLDKADGLFEENEVW